jgi:hypothetical protein
VWCLVCTVVNLQAEWQGFGDQRHLFLQAQHFQTHVVEYRVQSAVQPDHVKSREQERRAHAQHEKEETEKTRLHGAPAAGMTLIITPPSSLPSSSASSPSCSRRGGACGEAAEADEAVLLTLDFMQHAQQQQ